MLKLLYFIIGNSGVCLEVETFTIIVRVSRVQFVHCSSFPAEQMKKQAGVSLYGEEIGVLQGDIILTDATVDAIVSSVLPREYVESRTRRAVTSLVDHLRWENATVPYVFDEELCKFILILTICMVFKIQC